MRTWIDVLILNPEKTALLIKAIDNSLPSINVEFSEPDEQHFTQISELLQSFGIQACYIKKLSPHHYQPFLLSGNEFSEEELANLGLKWSTEEQAEWVYSSIY